MPPHEPHFRLNDYEAVNDHSEEPFWQSVAAEQDMLTVLAEHHTSDDQHSFYVLHNGAATWGIPGQSQIVALHLKRDVAARTFRFEHAELPLPAMAQSWLIARGCPEDEILLAESVGTAPADDTTRTLEARLRGDGDHFVLLASYTHDSEPEETAVLLRALDERAQLPYRVLLEEVDTDSRTHTLREGGFATREAAIRWWEAHWRGEDTPLPAAPPPARHTALPSPPAPVLPTPPRGPGR